MRSSDREFRRVLFRSRCAAAQPARHSCIRHFVVEGTQPMKALYCFSMLAGAAALGTALPSIAAENRDPRQSVGRAHDAARVEPERPTFLNAIQKSRSEERRVGNECVMTCNIRWSEDT